MIRFISLTAVVALLPGVAFAHGIGVQAKLKGDTIHVEGFYDDDTPAAGAKLAVVNESGAVVAEGKADKAGRWSFPAPAAGKYTLKLDAGGGHLATTTLTVSVRAVPTTPAPSASAAPQEPETVVSDGPTREETTGIQRLWMALVGIAVIGGLTAVAYWFSRPKPSSAIRSEPEA